MGFREPGDRPRVWVSTATEKLEAALQAAIEDPEVVQKMEDLGLETSYLGAEEYEQFWAQQETDYKEVLPMVQADE